MKVLDKYRIDIFKLPNEVHEYRFDIEDEFFELFEFSELNEGKGTCHITLDKSSSMITLDFDLSIKVKLICDRSLDEYDHFIDTEDKIMLKYGEEELDLSDEVKVITQNTQSVNVSQYIFEMLMVNIPMKKLHPRFDEVEDSEDEMIYTSGEEEETHEEKAVDPRWNALKDLNNNI